MPLPDQDAEVEVHGGTLALASSCVDQPRTPIIQAPDLGSAGALVAQTPPRSLNGRALEEAFAKWILQQSEDKQKAIVRNYDSLKAQEEQWVANIAVQEASTPKRRPVKKRVATGLQERLEVGNAYSAWRATAGATSRSPLKDPGEILGMCACVCVCNAVTRLGPVPPMWWKFCGRALCVGHQLSDFFLLKRLDRQSWEGSQSGDVRHAGSCRFHSLGFGPAPRRS